MQLSSPRVVKILYSVTKENVKKKQVLKVLKLLKTLRNLSKV